MQIAETVRTFVLGRRPELELADDDPLVELGVLDSLGILELVTFLEEHFGIRVDDQEMVPEHFGTLQRIEDFILAKTTNATR
jgi:acyl carrier protein